MSFAPKLRILHFQILFLLLLIICCVGLLFCYYNESDIKQCFQRPAGQGEEEEEADTPQMLDDVLVGTPPHLGASIFFHETSCRETHKDEPVQFNVVNLTARAACAVESAALHNPNSDIFVLFASPVYWDDTNENSIINTILCYKNVKLRNLDLWRYAAETPVEQWLQTKKLFRSRYLVSHMSDFLRYLTLWRFGGTYLDMDVIVLRSLEDLPPNFVGAESKSLLNSAVINFGYDDVGRKIAEYSLNDFQHNFDGCDWINNGPGVITRTLKHICQTDQIADMFDKERCLGFQVYTRDAFYAIHWSEWSQFFDKDHKETTLKRIENSIVTHVWNKLSEQRKVLKEDDSAWVELAAQHCPKVFAIIKDYF